MQIKQTALALALASAMAIPTAVSAQQVTMMTGPQGGTDLSLTSTSRHALFDWDDKRSSDKTYAQYGRGSQLKVGTGYWFVVMLRLTLWNLTVSRR